MTHEQDWAFYKLIPKLREQFGIVFYGDDGIASDAEIGQAILDIAAENGVSIDADAACETCAEEDGLVMADWTFLDVPVVNGTATLPDGRTVQSTANTVRVPVLRETPTS